MNLVVSIISHNHSSQVNNLLNQLINLNVKELKRVVITINVPESFNENIYKNLNFKLEVIRNKVPQGFGQNHNFALSDATEDLVCLLNPDVQFINNKNIFNELIYLAKEEKTGCSYPIQCDRNGREIDYERDLLTIGSLFKRYVKKNKNIKEVFWVNAAFMVIPIQVWRNLDGFDTRYFMYCEDTDICLRMKVNNLLLRKSSEKIFHEGSRASHRKLKYFYWHLKSLIKLWNSPSYKQIVKCK